MTPRTDHIRKLARRDYLETVAMWAAAFTATTAATVLGVIVSLWTMGVIP